MRRALLPTLALAGLSCARDLELPSSSPPRIDSVQVLGLEAAAAPVPLPVLGGELVAIRGGGFVGGGAPAEVEIGGIDAEVIEVTQDRIVARVPTLDAFGAADLRVRTSVGFRTQVGALRYEGPGQPQGFGTSDLPTSPRLGFVAPVQPPDATTGFPDLAIAIGASDSALLVVPAVGFAATTVPLGLVPSSAAARIVSEPPNYRVQVLALTRGGEAALGSAVIDSSGSIANRVAARPLASLVDTRACSFPQVMFTNGGTPVAAWVTSADARRIAVIDMPRAEGSAEYAPAGTAYTLPAPIVGWAPWQASSVVFAAGSELYVFDASTPETPPAVLADGLGRSVSSLLAFGCPATQGFYTLAAASSGLGDALAVSYRAADGDRVALLDLADLATGLAPGSIHRGLAGTIATSLALVPEPPYGSSPNLQWSVLAAGFSTMFRFRPLTGVPGACPQDLVPDAALTLSAEPGILPTFGGMITAAGGTRVLSTTPDGDLITVLPPSLTSAGPVFRVASYAGLSVQNATLGSEVAPIAIAEHASFESSLSELDTGSALLVVSLSGSQGSLALGGSGFGRGAVWLDPAPGAGALAYTGDLPAPPTGTVSRGGAAAVTGVTAGACPNEEVRVTGSRPVANGADLVAQGPARSGALGPSGTARYGPAAPPVYAARDTVLGAYLPDPAKLACLAGAGDIDWAACAPDATLDLGVVPLDVTLSAGDRAVAARSLEPDPAACAPAPGFPTTCAADDLLCQRASCPPAMSLQLARAGAAATTLPLPARPAGLAADRGGGFLVTLPCALSSAAGGDDCFPASPICDGFLTGPGGADAALVLVAEDGSTVDCLAVLPALAGPVAVTPNGAEAWVTGSAFGAQILSRVALPRRTSDGTIDPSRPAERVAAEALGTAARATGAFPIGGVAFTPDGGTGIVTVPGQFQIMLYQ